MGSSIAWLSTQVRRTASSARVSKLSVSYDYGLTKSWPSAGSKCFLEKQICTHIHSYWKDIYHMNYIMFTCEYVCVCVRPSTVKASSVWIKWDTREQIKDVMLKTWNSSAGSFHRYIGMQNLTFQLATLSCSHTRSGQSHDSTSIRLAFRT